MKKSIIALAMTSACLTPWVKAQQDTSEIITVVGKPLRTTEAEDVNWTTNTDADFGNQLAKLAGVSIARNGPVTGLIQYRGLFGDRVGVTIDGVDIAGAGPNAMDSPLSHLLPEPGMQAVLYRGIVPVSAGVQTLGGQLDIRAPATSLFAQPEGGQLNISASLISPGKGEQYQANGLYRWHDGFLSAAVTHQQRDYSETARNAQIPNSHYLRNGAKVRGGYEWGDHQLAISYQSLNTNHSGTPALAMDIGFIDAAWYRLNYRYQLSTASYFAINIVGNSNQHAMDNFRQRPLVMASMARENHADSVAQGVNAHYVTRLGAGELDTGVHFAHSKNNSVISNPNNNSFYINNFAATSKDTYSLFSEWQGTLDKVEYLIGARYTQVDTNAGKVDSNMVMMNEAVATLANNFNQAQRKRTFNMLDLAATLALPISDRVHFFTGVSQKNRAPSYYQSYTWLPLGITGGMADGFNYIGDTQLEHETARQFETGVTLRTPHWTLSPRLFYQDIENYITGSPSENPAAIMFSTMMSGTTPFQWANTDAIIKGVDVTLTGELSDNLTLNMVARHNHGNRDDIDDALFRIAPEQLTTTLKWQTGLFDTPLSTHLTSELIGRQSHVSSLQGEQATSGYGLIHLGATWHIYDGVSIATQLNNAFNKDYTPHVAGVNRVSGDSSINVGDKLPGVGREWHLSIQLTF